jgi:hypothetical protein
VRWNNATTVLHNLNLKLIEAPTHQVDALEVEIASQEEVVLGLEAPHLRAVLSKLQLLWSVDLNNPDYDGQTKRRIVADLSNLIGLAA